MSHKRHISFLLIWPQGSQVYQKMLRHPLNSLEVLCAKIEPKLFFENSSILTNLSAPNLQIPPVTPGDLPKVGKKFSSKGYCGYANMGKFECMYLSWLECINAGSMVIVLNWKWLLWLCFRKFALNLKILLQTDSNFVCMAQDIFQIDMQ